MNGLEILSDFIEAPRRAADDARRRPSVLLGLAGYLVAALSLFMARKLVGQAGLAGTFLFALAALFVLRAGLGVVQTGVVHLVAEALGGRGGAVPLFTLMGLSELAWALVLPAVLIVQAAGAHSGWVFMAIFSLAYLLSLSLKARSIRHNYGLGTVKAWSALLFPYAAAAAVAAAALTAALVAVFQQVVQALA